MCANDPIRIVLTDHLDQRPSVELVEKQTPFFVLPRLVELVVHPAQGFGHMVDQTDICLAVETPKKRVGKFEHVFVTYLFCQPFDLESLLQRLSGSNVPVADRGGKDEYSFEHIARLYIRDTAREIHER